MFENDSENLNARRTVFFNVIGLVGLIDAAATLGYWLAFHTAWANSTLDMLLGPSMTAGIEIVCVAFLYFEYRGYLPGGRRTVAKKEEPKVEPKKEEKK